jgi:hypothetical protein
MSTPSFNGLLIISVIAVMAPILAATVKRLTLPSPVVEIAAGVIVGPSVLGWVRIDEPVNVVALLGLAFLLFLAGLEIDLRATTSSQFRAPLAGFAGSLLLGVAAGVAFHAAGWVRDPFFLAITLSATSLGLVVPVLTDAGQSRTVFGQVTIAGATVGEFGAITCVGRGDVVQRRLARQHALDLVQPHSELAQRAHQARPGDRIGTEEPVARFAAPGLGQHAGVGVEAQRPDRHPGAEGELADRHAHHCAASTRWRVKTHPTPGRSRACVSARASTLCAKGGGR